MSSELKGAEYIDGGRFIVEVIRSSRRKTAQIKVESTMVSVVAPKTAPIEQLERVIQNKRSWILQKVAAQREAMPVNQRQFISGESIPYLGRNYRLKVEQGPFAPPKLVHGRLHIQTPDGSNNPHLIRNALIRWYKRNALNRLEQKTKRYSAIIGVEPTTVSVREFKSRWGSCTSKKELQYNWRIIMAPNRMCDYVVIHELCHLIHHDHSQKFWQHVERIMPEYAECREWLKQHAEQLQF
jgi:predicted metal-dependent hydrolase